MKISNIIEYIIKKSCNFYPKSFKNPQIKKPYIPIKIP